MIMPAVIAKMGSTIKLAGLTSMPNAMQTAPIKNRIATNEVGAAAGASR
jgi:hypothetical protein